MIVVAIRIVLLGAFVVLLACGIGLFVMSGVAQSHDVVRIPVPNSTFVGGAAPTSHYADAYIAPMRYSSFTNIERVAQQAFHRGEKEVFRDEREVAYEGKTLGLTYVVSYILAKETSPPTLTVATTVNLASKRKGRFYWMLVKPVHRHLMPYLLDRMVIMAPD
jgi:hypothetical protein